MKLLFVTPYVPTLIRVRPYQLLRALVRRGHQVTLATLWTTTEEAADLQRLREFGLQVVAQRLPRWRSLGNSLLALPTSTPLQAVYCWQPALMRQLQELIINHNFDLLHVEHLRGARYGLAAQQLCRRRHKPLPVVWDSVDCISHLFAQATQHSSNWRARLITQIELPRTRAYESRLVRGFDSVVVTSPIDQQALERLAMTEMEHQRNHFPSPSRQPIGLVPNGVDLEHFAPTTTPRRPATLVYSGKMSYHANIAAVVQLVQEIMPQVWRECPEVELWIVGKDPAPEVRRLAAAGPTRRVLVTGTVPDLSSYLQQATIAVAPVTYGAGIQNKVLEAMACAAPVIASSQACSALQAQNGRDLVVADGVQPFSQAILQLLTQPGQQQLLGQAARRYVEEQHSWDAVAGQLEEIYRCAIERKVEQLHAS